MKLINFSTTRIWKLLEPWPPSHGIPILKYTQATTPLYSRVWFSCRAERTKAKANEVHGPTRFCLVDGTPDGRQTWKISWIYLVHARTYISTSRASEGEEKLSPNGAQRTPSQFILFGAAQLEVVVRIRRLRRGHSSDAVEISRAGGPTPTSTYQLHMKLYILDEYTYYTGILDDPRYSSHLVRRGNREFTAPLLALDTFCLCKCAPKTRRGEIEVVKVQR